MRQDRLREHRPPELPHAVVYLPKLVRAIYRLPVIIRAPAVKKSLEVRVRTKLRRCA